MAQGASEAVSYTHLDVYKRQEVFSLRDDGFAEAAPGPVPETAQETAAEAMDACPTSAIEEG